METLTPNQRKAVEEIARNAAHNEAQSVLGKHTRNGIIGFLILLAGLGAGKYTDAKNSNESRDTIAASGNAVAVLSCNRDFGSQRKLRSLIRAQRKSISALVSEGTLTKQQGRRAQRDITKNVKQTPLPDCRVTKNSVTSDPDQKVRSPHALYPGDPKARAILDKEVK